MAMPTMKKSRTKVFSVEKKDVTKLPMILNEYIQERKAWIDYTVSCGYIIATVELFDDDGVSNNNE